MAVATRGGRLFNGRTYTRTAESSRGEYCARHGHSTSPTLPIATVTVRVTDRFNQPICRSDIPLPETSPTPDQGQYSQCNRHIIDKSRHLRLMPSCLIEEVVTESPTCAATELLSHVSYDTRHDCEWACWQQESSCKDTRQHP